MNKENTNTSSVEELYLKEKKKSMILLVTTVLFATLFLSSLAFDLGSDSNDSDTGSSAQTEHSIDGQQNQGGPGQGRGQGRAGQDITAFFNDDGSVDQDAVDTFAERIGQGGGPQGADSSQFLDRFSEQIYTAVESGDITQTQGEELLSALSEIDLSGN